MRFKFKSGRGLRVVVCALIATGIAAGYATSPRAAEDLASRVAELPNDMVKSGDCGAFLWGKTDRRSDFLLFVSSADGAAHIMIDGGVKKLPRVSADGASARNQYENMAFAGDGWTAQLSGKIPPGNKAMSAFKEATLRIADANGAEAAFTVGGLISCRQRQEAAQ